MPAVVAASTNNLGLPPFVAGVGQGIRTSLPAVCSDRDRWHARLEIDEGGNRPTRVVRTVREIDGHGGVRGGYTVHETSELDARM